MSAQSSRGPHVDMHTQVTIVTGFLGSGKTTLLNRALRDPVMKGTLIVVNEFGEISIDHALTAASNDSILILQNGCLCCTVFGDLVQTLNRAYYTREAGEISFDQVVIETSGLAEPAPVVQAFLSDPTLEGLYRVGAVIATVDAVNGPATLLEHAASQAQIAVADHVVITKLDLIGDPQRAAARESLIARLRRFNRSARINAVEDAGFDIVRLMRQDVADPSQGPEAAKAWLEPGLALAQDGGEHAEHASRHQHESSISSFNLVRETALPREALQLLLSSLEQHLGPRLLRVKGLINVAEEPDRPAVLQGAQHLLHNLTWLERWPDEDHRTRIVFITQGIETEELSEMVTLLERVAQRTAAARLRASAAAGIKSDS